MQPRLASEHGLITTSPSAMSTRGTSSLGYVRGAIGSPVCVALMVFAACVGLGVWGAFGALLAIVLVIGVGATSSQYAVVRRHIDRQTAIRDRCKRELHRLKQLRPTGPVRQQQYIELRELVEEIERIDPAEATRFELQDLLDHFVRFAISHHRCLDALRLAGGADLPQTIPLHPTGSKRRREILARRLLHREECLRRIDRLSDELEAIDELVRLVAQRAACPALDADLDREIERRLWELDEVDAALHQLSA